MPSELPRLFLARHGDTAWTDSRQHTGRTDMPLNQGGRGPRPAAWRAAASILLRVACSPARYSVPRGHASWPASGRTQGSIPTWSSGTMAASRGADQEILKRRPGWELFRDGCPEGESPEDVAARADRFIARVRASRGTCWRSRAATSSGCRGPLARLAAGRRTVLLLPDRQRGGARLSSTGTGTSRSRPLEPSRSTEGVSRADRGLASQPVGRINKRSGSS